MEILNTEIMRHPLNWITLFLMVFIAMWAVGFMSAHYTNLKQGNHLVS